MKINKQMLFFNLMLICLPAILYLILQNFFDSNILFTILMIYLIGIIIISKLFANKNSKIKFIYDNVVNSKNAPINRGPIIFWGSLFTYFLIFLTFIFSGFFDYGIGRMLFFIIAFGFFLFIQCTTFNFENKKG
ncbi:hypothetical protein DY102_04905 [Apilactobacillus timberlakei]|uniref:hypothetical protein n=1 Tax=Apilactobacillus timberlakei TaxID=2008380 RepID=UPI001126C1B3|nr:hypothetical protein [Apilactobacillus timberlakei]TPR23385.1 hypothetical protein DY102_04905 [Apilactobacillus timberlakei]